MATSAGDTASARLPQLLRTKLKTSATLASLSRQSSPGMANADGDAAVAGLLEPCSTMRINDVGLLAATVLLCARDGNAALAPLPLDWWQPAQLFRYTSAPLWLTWPLRSAAAVGLDASAG